MNSGRSSKKDRVIEEIVFFTSIEALSNRKKIEVVRNVEQVFRVQLKGKTPRMKAGESGCKHHYVNRREAGSK